MKTLFYIILLLIVLAGFAAGIYYLVNLDYSSISDKVSGAVDGIGSAINNIASYVDSVNN